MENKLKELRLIVRGLVNNLPIKIKADLSFAMEKKGRIWITQRVVGVGNCY